MDANISNNIRTSKEFGPWTAEQLQAIITHLKSDKCQEAVRASQDQVAIEHVQLMRATTPSYETRYTPFMR